MSSDPIEVLLDKAAALEKVLPVAREYAHAPEVREFREALTAALASLSAPKPESAEAVIPWVREWKGSGPQRGFHIREATRLHNNRVVAYLGDQVDGDEVDKLIAEHNGKHPNGDPVRPTPPRPEASEGEPMTGDLLPCPFCGKSNQDRFPCEWLDDSGANVIRCAWCHGAAPMSAWNRRAAPQQASAPVGVELVDAARAVVEDHTDYSARVRLRKALAQQPAPVAPVGVEGRAREAVALALDEAGHHTEADNVRKGIDLDEYRAELTAARIALAQQPAAEATPVAVDEAVARKMLGALELLLPTAQRFEAQASKGTGGRRGGLVFEKARAAIESGRAALAGQHQENGNGE